MFLEFNDSNENATIRSDYSRAQCDIDGANQETN